MHYESNLICSHKYSIVLTIPAGLILLLLLQVAFSQDDLVKPPDSILAEGFSISSAIKEETSRYSTSRVGFFQSWHPLRREMLITTRFGQNNQAHLVKLPGGARNQLTFVEGGARWVSFQPTHGRFFVFTNDKDADGTSQLYSFDFETRRIEKLTPDRYDVGAFVWSKDGKYVIYAAVDEKNDSSEICLLDPLNPLRERCIKKLEGVVWDAHDISPDGRSILVWQYKSTGDTALHILDTGNGEFKQLTPNDKPAAYNSGQFSADGKGVYFRSNRNREFYNLDYLEFATGSITTVLPFLEQNCERYALSPKGKYVAYDYNIEGTTLIGIYDLEARKQVESPSIPPGFAFGEKWRNEQELGFILNNVKTAGDAFSYDLKTKEITRWTNSETSGLQTDDFPDAKLIKWKSYDGLEISGFLFAPPERFKSRKAPVLVDIHGGPQLQARPTFLGEDNYFINEMGFAIVLPNIRGSSGFGQTFMDADNGRKRKGAIDDISALLDWIEKQPNLDREQVFVRGESYGGLVTLALAMRKESRLRGILLKWPIVSIETYINNLPKNAQTLVQTEYGDGKDEQIKEFFDSISVLKEPG